MMWGPACFYDTGTWACHVRTCLLQLPGFVVEVCRHARLLMYPHGSCLCPCRHGLLRTEGHAADEEQAGAGGSEEVQGVEGAAPAASLHADGGGLSDAPPSALVPHSAREGGPKVLADALEALLAAAYLDAGCDMELAGQVGLDAGWEGDMLLGLLQAVVP